jgi:hypothetical protein
VTGCDDISDSYRRAGQQNGVIDAPATRSPHPPATLTLLFIFHSSVLSISLHLVFIFVFLSVALEYPEQSTARLLKATSNSPLEP